jgi:hypothetical protein
MRTWEKNILISTLSRLSPVLKSPRFVQPLLVINGGVFASPIYIKVIARHYAPRDTPCVLHACSSPSGCWWLRPPSSAAATTMVALTTTTMENLLVRLLLPRNSRLSPPRAQFSLVAPPFRQITVATRGRQPLRAHREGSGREIYRR